MGQSSTNMPEDVARIIPESASLSSLQGIWTSITPIMKALVSYRDYYPQFTTEEQTQRG